MSLQKRRGRPTDPNSGVYALRLITYLARVETGGVQLYTAKGVLTHAIRQTRLIERDCCILSRDISSALKEIEETDICFVRMLKTVTVEPNTVVHILDRATNCQEKA